MSVCLYSCLSYPASRSHLFYAVLYCHLWHVWLYYIFLRYLITVTIFGKKLLNIQCVFWLPVQILSEIFLIIRRIQRYIITSVCRSLSQVSVIFCQIWIKLKLPRKIFEKSSNIEFHENVCSGIRVVPYGWTDVMKLIVTFRDFASTPNLTAAVWRTHIRKINRKITAFNYEFCPLCK
jgi:hypothetical protein